MENLEIRIDELVGTEHDLQSIKKGNEELENWLRGNLSRNADFDIRKR